MPKKTSILVLVALLVSYSCSDQTDPIDENIPVDDPIVEAEVIAEFIDDDIEKMVLFHMFSLYGVHEEGGGNIETHFRPNPYIGRSNCASVNIDEKLQRITIDFGPGCEAPNGILRAGKVIANFSNEQEGMFENIDITLEGYTVENIQVQGDRYLINDIVDLSLLFPYKYISDSITSGLLAFNDGTTYTYESVRSINTYTLPTNDDQFIYNIKVDKVGIDRNGQPFEMRSTETISYSSECFSEGVGQITRGSFQLITNQTHKQVEFENSCGTEVLVTVSDSFQYRLDLDQLSINN